MTSNLLKLPVVGLVILAPSLISASKFSTNCTLPTESTTLVSSANIRGTFDILWSGLFTIFICIWTVQHLNVPEQRKGRDRGWKRDLKWTCKGFLSKLKWMGFTLIFPEFLVAKAFAERTTARTSIDEVKTLRCDDGTKPSRAEISNWTRTHAFYAEMGGFVVRPYGNERPEVRRIATADILKMRKQGFLQVLPTISADRLNDMSNGDAFTKAAAVGQVTWLVVQVIVRATKGLPITQLEITACGFAASTFLTYLLWWDKPQAVTTVTELPMSAESDELGSCLHHRAFCVTEAVLYLAPPPRNLLDDEPMPNDTIAMDVSNQFLLGFLLGGIMLGCIECAAWNFEFPTNVELYFWRVSSVVTMAAVPVLYVTIISLIVGFGEHSTSANLLLTVMSCITMAFFFMGRLFILFETIYSVFHLPPGAFVSTWSSSIPHVA